MILDKINIFEIVSAATSVLSLFFIIYSIPSFSYRKFSGYFMLFSSVLFLASLSTLVTLYNKNYDIAFVSAQVSAICILLSSPAFLLFINSFVENRLSKLGFTKILFFMPAVILIAIMSLLNRGVEIVSSPYGYILAFSDVRIMVFAYLLPFNLFIISVLGIKVYHDRKANKVIPPNIILLTGLILHTIGDSVTPLMMKKGIIPIMPLNTLYSFTWFLFIAVAIWSIETNISNLVNKTILGNSKDAIMVINSNDSILRINDVMKNLLSDKNFSYKETIDDNILLQYLESRTDDKSKAEKFVKAVNISYDEDFYEEMAFLKDENKIIFEVRVSNIFNGNIKIGKIIILHDITKFVLSEEAAKNIEKRYRTLFENSSDGIYISTPDGTYIDVNQSLVSILGYESREELLAVNTKNLYFSEEDRPPQDERDKVFTVQLKKKDGGKVWVEISPRVIYDKGMVLYEGIVRDITERKKSQENIEYLSFHDSLTGLYNRAYFEEELKRLDTPRLIPISIVMGDLNGLKIINDAYGHDAGDILLKKIADILKSCFRKNDIVARWGGDEFVIILPKTTVENTDEIIDRIKKSCIENSLELMPLSISMGVAAKLDASQDIKEIMGKAEDDMYRHKLSEKQGIQNSIISSLERTLDKKNYETEKHIQQVKNMALKLGNLLKLPENKIDELILLATLHDIGKIAVADNILSKPGKLTSDEWELIKKHPEVGYRIAESSPELAVIAEDILAHHEWWNGSGYPRGLQGNNIPLPSRIIAVIDAYDAMINDKPYRKAMTEDDAIEELKRCSGTQFDPEIVEQFIKILFFKE
ncbi:MAG: diguanylate cyclase [Actinobacteria bacterium]|nr:diguanylate cyclase [Actinomycetota bacterium]